VDCLPDDCSDLSKAELEVLNSLLVWFRCQGVCTGDPQQVILFLTGSLAERIGVG
jgi:hypothetical protein